LPEGKTSPNFNTMIMFPEDYKIVECVDIENLLYPEHEIIPPDNETGDQ
jgi:hypothetical protein